MLPNVGHLSQYRQGESFNYLGPTVNGYNSIEEEIKETIALGNKA